MTRTNRRATIKLGNNFLTPKVIGRNGLTFPECIAELVANSFDWRITKTDPTQKTIIKVVVTRKGIQVIDNGAGMTIDELDTAIDLAESGDDLRERLDDEVRKGMYGLGMKVAALSLGWKFTINTISASDPCTENIFELNSRNLEDKESNYLEELQINTGPRLQNSPLKDFTSGTAILIEDLAKDVISIVALGRQMEERFSPDINNLIDQGKLEFTIYDNEGTDPYPVRRLDVSHQFEDDVLRIDFEHPQRWAQRTSYKYKGSDGQEYQLRGYLQLLKERKVADQSFGLNLYCKGQLIERFHKEKDGLFTIAGRLGEKTYGEIHLDGCLPDNVKAHGFIRDAAFLAVRELIREDLEIYKGLSPATGIGATRVKEEINRRKGIGGEQGNGPGNEGDQDTPPSGDDNSGNGGGNGNPPGSGQPNPPVDPMAGMPAGTIMINKRLFIQVQNSWVYMTGSEKRRNVSWEPLYIKSKLHNDLYELKVYINPESNIYKAILENYPQKNEQLSILSFFKRMAICESINQVLISSHDYYAEDAREVTDTIVTPFVMKMKLD